MSTDRHVCPDETAVAPSVSTLLGSARRGLLAGKCDTSAARRYIAAHLTALRAAAAVVAAGAAPGGGEGGGLGRRPRSIWELLSRVEPAFEDWAAYFAAGAGKRAAAEAGRRGAVTLREADELLRDAETFLSLAEERLVCRQNLIPRSRGTSRLSGALSRDEATRETRRIPWWRRFLTSLWLGRSEDQCPSR